MKSTTSLAVAAAVALGGVIFLAYVMKKRAPAKPGLALSKSTPPPLSTKERNTPPPPMVAVMLSLELIVELFSDKSVSMDSILDDCACVLQRYDFPNETDKQRFKFMLSVLKLGRSAVERDARELIGQVLGRVLPPFNEITSFYVEQCTAWLESNKGKLEVFLPVGFGSHSGLKLAGGAEVATKALPSDANAILLVNHQAWLVAGCEDGRVLVFDAKSLKQVELQPEMESFHADQITALASTPQYVFTASADGKLAAWDLKNGCRFVAELGVNGDVAAASACGHLARITGLQVAYDKLYSASHDGNIYVWDLKTLLRVAILRMRDEGDWITALAVGEDGHVFCGTDVGALHAWQNELDSNAVIRHDAHDSDIVCLLAHARTQRLFSGSWDETIKIWDYSTLAPLHTLSGHADWVTALALNETGQVLFSASRDCQIRVWEKEQSTRVLLGHTSTVSSLQLNADLLFSASSHLRTFEWNNSICFTENQLGHSMQVLCVVATADLAVCMTGGKDNNILIWDMIECSTNAAGLLEGHCGWVNCLALCREDTILVSGSGDLTLRVWDWNGTGECLRVLSTMHQHWIVNVMVLQGNGGEEVMIASEDYSGKRTVWNLDTGNQVETDEAENLVGLESEALCDGGNVLDLQTRGGSATTMVVGYTRDEMDPSEEFDETKIKVYKNRRLVLAPRGKDFEAWKLF